VEPEYKFGHGKTIMLGKTQQTGQKTYSFRETGAMPHGYSGSGGAAGPTLRLLIKDRPALSSLWELRAPSASAYAVPDSQACLPCPMWST
jgi:hypothetical protein